jgi:hypothetical protein
VATAISRVQQVVNNFSIDKLAWQHQRRVAILYIGLGVVQKGAKYALVVGDKIYALADQFSVLRPLDGKTPTRPQQPLSLQASHIRWAIRGSRGPSSPPLSAAIAAHSNMLFGSVSLLTIATRQFGLQNYMPGS